MIVVALSSYHRERVCLSVVFYVSRCPRLAPRVFSSPAAHSFFLDITPLHTYRTSYTGLLSCHRRGLGTRPCDVG
jgi:hypothetical protein